MANSEMASNVGVITATGHGFALPNEIGEAPLNIVFSGPKPEKLNRWTR